MFSPRIQRCSNCLSYIPKNLCANLTLLHSQLPLPIYNPQQTFWQHHVTLIGIYSIQPTPSRTNREANVKTYIIDIQKKPSEHLVLSRESQTTHWQTSTAGKPRQLSQSVNNKKEKKTKPETSKVLNLEICHHSRSTCETIKSCKC